MNYLKSCFLKHYSFHVLPKFYCNGNIQSFTFHSDHFSNLLFLRIMIKPKFDSTKLAKKKQIPFPSLSAFPGCPQNQNNNVLSFIKKSVVKLNKTQIN